MIFEDFIWRALLGGAGVAMVSGPLGCFIVWRRMAYFGDSLAHSALLGVGLGFLLGVDTRLGTLAACVALALLLVLLQNQKRLSSDTLLGILAHTALSLGLVVISFMESLRVDLLGYLLFFTPFIIMFITPNNSYCAVCNPRCICISILTQQNR